MKYFFAWLLLPGIALAASSGFTVGFQTGDSNAPTVPTALTATAVSNSQINLSWTASTDTFGVAGYRVFRDSVFLATSTVTTYSNTGLTASTTYSYTVSAFDAALNISAHSATATATTSATASTPTTTPASTTTPSSGSTGGYRRVPQSGEVFLPVAVSNLQIVSGIGRIALQWQNPIDDRFVGVRIIRSEKGFPQDAYDGAVVFLGQGDVFIDREVVAGKTYYYGVFAVYDGNIFASPAVTFGASLIARATEEVKVDELLPEPLFLLKEFNFRQAGEDLELVDGKVIAKAGIPIEIYLAGDALPKEARVVVVELSTEGQTKSSWVLVYDRNTGKYQAVLPVLSSGDFTVTGAVYDSTFALIGEGGDGQLSVIGIAKAVSLTPGGSFWVDLLIDWWWLWLILLLLLVLLYRLFKEHGYEKST